MPIYTAEQLLSGGKNGYKAETAFDFAPGMPRDIMGTIINTRTPEVLEEPKPSQPKKSYTASEVVAQFGPTAGPITFTPSPEQQATTEANKAQLEKMRKRAEFVSRQGVQLSEGTFGTPVKTTKPLGVTESATTYGPLSNLAMWFEEGGKHALAQIKSALAGAYVRTGDPEEDARRLAEGQARAKQILDEYETKAMDHFTAYEAAKIDQAQRQAASGVVSRVVGAANQLIQGAAVILPASAIAGPVAGPASLGLSMGAHGAAEAYTAGASPDEVLREATTGIATGGTLTKISSLKSLPNPVRLLTEIGAMFAVPRAVNPDKALAGEMPVTLEEVVNSLFPVLVHTPGWTAKAYRHLRSKGFSEAEAKQGIQTVERLLLEYKPSSETKGRYDLRTGKLREQPSTGGYIELPDERTAMRDIVPTPLNNATVDFPRVPTRDVQEAYVNYLTGKDKPIPESLSEFSPGQEMPPDLTGLSPVALENALSGKRKTVPGEPIVRGGRKSDTAKPLWEMTLGEFAEAASKGKLRKATGVKLPGESEARTALRLGEINSYSPNDIARFYVERAGSVEEGYKQLRAAAAKEGRIAPAPTEIPIEPAAPIATEPATVEIPKPKGKTLVAKDGTEIEILPGGVIRETGRKIPRKDLPASSMAMDPKELARTLFNLPKDFKTLFDWAKETYRTKDDIANAHIKAIKGFMERFAPLPETGNTKKAFDRLDPDMVLELADRVESLTGRRPEISADNYNDILDMAVDRMSAQSNLSQLFAERNKYLNGTEDIPFDKLRELAVKGDKEAAAAIHLKVTGIPRSASAFDSLIREVMSYDWAKAAKVAKQLGVAVKGTLTQLKQAIVNAINKVKSFATEEARRLMSEDTGAAINPFSNIRINDNLPKEVQSRVDKINTPEQSAIFEKLETLKGRQSRLFLRVKNTKNLPAYSASMDPIDILRDALSLSRDLNEKLRNGIAFIRTKPNPESIAQKAVDVELARKVMDTVTVKSPLSATDRKKADINVRTRRSLSTLFDRYAKNDGTAAANLRMMHDITMSGIASVKEAVESGAPVEDIVKSIMTAQSAVVREVNMMSEAGQVLRQVQLLTGNPHTLQHILDQMFKSIREGGMSKKNREYLMDLFNNLENPEALIRLARKITDPTVRDYVYALYYSGMMNGTGTWIINGLSTGVSTLFHLGLRYPEAGFDKLISALTGRERRVLFSSVQDILTGMKEAKSISQARKEMLRILKTNEPSRFESIEEMEMDFAARPFERAKDVKLFGRDISKGLNYAAPFINFGSRISSATDMGFRVALFDGLLREQVKVMAYNRLVKGGLKILRDGDPIEIKKGDRFTDADVNWLTEAILRGENAESRSLKQIAELVASDIAREWTFNARPEASIKKLIDFRNSFVLARVVVPFARTMANLARLGIELTPGLGLAKEGAGRIARQAGYDVFKSEEMQSLLAKQLVGTALTITALSLADSGIIQGSGPSRMEPDKFEAWIREGNLPYSIKIGNTRVEFKWLGPFAMPLLLGVSMHDALRELETKAIGETDKDVKAAEIVNNTLSKMSAFFVDSFWPRGLTQLSDIVDSRKGVGDGLARYSMQVAQNFNPYGRLISQATTLNEMFTQDQQDEIFKGTGLDAKEREYFYQTFMVNYPILRDHVPTKIDVFGRKVDVVGGLPKQWLGIGIRQKEMIPEEAELSRLTNEMESKFGAPYYPSPPSPTISVKTLGNPIGMTHTMSKELHQAYMVKSGDVFMQLLGKALRSDRYKRASLDKQVKMVSSMLDRSRKAARAELREFIEAEVIKTGVIKKGEKMILGDWVVKN